MSRSDQNRKVFVGNVPFDCSENDLRSLFEPFGVLEQVYLPKKKGSDQLAGYSFVTYTDVQTAEHVIAQGTLTLNGQELKLASAVRKAVPQSQQQSMMSPVAAMSPQQSNRLFVGGLNEVTSDETLRQHFSQFGEVTDCYIPKEKSGKQRGYGFVTFVDRDSMQRAINGPNILDGNSLNVNVAAPKTSTQTGSAPHHNGQGNMGNMGNSQSNMNGNMMVMVPSNMLNMMMPRQWNNGSMMMQMPMNGMPMMSNNSNMPVVMMPANQVGMMNSSGPNSAMNPMMMQGNMPGNMNNMGNMNSMNGMQGNMQGNMPVMDNQYQSGMPEQWQQQQQWPQQQQQQWQNQPMGNNMQPNGQAYTHAQSSSYGNQQRYAPY